VTALLSKAKRRLHGAPMHLDRSPTRVLHTLWLHSEDHVQFVTG
jgi:hypothetical protein